MKRSAGLAAAALFLGLLSSNVCAQQDQQPPPGGGGGGRGNFDPAQFRQRMMDTIRERLDIKSDDEWKVIEPRVQKVMDLRREVGGMGGFGFGRGGRGPGGPGGAGGGGRRGGGMFGTPSPEAEALQQALDSNASSDDLKAKLAKYRAAQKDKEAKLDQAQADLQKVLSVKQEATAVMLGLLK